MVMTVLLHDAKADLVAAGYTLSENLPAHELLYADDTLLIDADPEVVQQYMLCIEARGKEYLTPGICR